jgi:hypothetical protein
MDKLQLTLEGSVMTSLYVLVIRWLLISIKRNYNHFLQLEEENRELARSKN